MDLFHIHDVAGNKRWFLCVVDVATDYVTMVPCAGHSPEHLWECWETGWLTWAGPPDVMVSDNERGLIGEAFVTKLSRSGTVLWPTAAYAPWQKVRVERRIAAAKDDMRAIIMERGLKTGTAMKTVAYEVAHAYNQRPSASGFSPATRLFGTRARAYGEIYKNGEHLGWRLDAQMWAESWPREW